MAGARVARAAARAAAADAGGPPPPLPSPVVLSVAVGSRSPPSSGKNTPWSSRAPSPPSHSAAASPDAPGMGGAAPPTLTLDGAGLSAANISAVEAVWWLRACDGDVSRAEAALRATLSWRRTAGADRVLVDFAASAATGATSPTMSSAAASPVFRRRADPSDAATPNGSGRASPGPSAEPPAESPLASPLSPTSATADIAAAAARP